MIKEAQIQADLLVADLQLNYERLGLKASGQLGKSLNNEVVERDNGITILIKGQNYSYWLERGRKAGGKMPPYEAIRQWVKDKNIKSNIPEKSLIYLIRRKIGRDGIRVPNKYNAGGLISDVFTRERTRSVVEAVGSGFIALRKSEVIKALK